MGTMNFSIPDDLKEKFNQVFADENKSAVIARLMWQAIEQEERRQRDFRFVERMREIRGMTRMEHTDEEVRAALDELRK
jgi:hypothetical protein